MRERHRSSAAALAAVLVIFTVSPSILGTSAVADEGTVSDYVAVPNPIGFVLRDAGGRIACDELPVVGESILEIDPSIETRPILRRDQEKIRAGMTIELRGTAQLNSFPQAKAAFVRAAAAWEEIISSNITVIINVDFGPTRFGQTYPSGVLGSTTSQSVYRPSTGNYATVRSALVAHGTEAERATVYGALPADQLQTDLGPCTSVLATSSNLRALGILPPVANPSSEFSLGPAPAIGFNSEFDFDFNPEDGIDGSSFDFDAVAVHEIGHALGFISNVGAKELSPGAPVAVSMWDIFRFRPGTTLGTIGTASRILSSGGEQRYFVGTQDLGLSTGRADHSGGDGEQASHWKSDDVTGRYIGIMDPTVARGDREEITENDRMAIQFMGYAMRGLGESPIIQSTTADLDGDVLTLSGSGSDPDGNVTKVQVVFYDGTGVPLGRSAEVDLQVGPAQTFDFSFQVSGLGAITTATRAGVFLIDADGNQSVLAKIPFDEAEEGGPRVTKGAFKAAKSALKITGRGFDGTLRLEINGVLYGSPVTANGAGTKIKITGTAGALGLRSGLNRVRILSDGLHSNIVLVKA
jgi:hypothetical protein